MSSLSMRDAFFGELYQAAQADPSICVLSNDQGAPSLDRFRSDLPEQFINVGIAEQNQIALAAGLSLSGRRVIVYGITPFVTLRCYEQLKVDVCIMRQPVILAGVGAGFGYGVAGPTHHALEDIATMRALSGMQVYCPSDSRDVGSLLRGCLQRKAPCYLRLDRECLEVAQRPARQPPSGLHVLHRGHTVGLVACGVMVHRALELAERLRERGLNPTIIDLYQLKPLPGSALRAALGQLDEVVTLEEHSLNGGLGSIVAEWLADSGLSMRLQRIGVADDQLYGYGDRPHLHRTRGLDVPSILAQLEDREFLSRHARGLVESCSTIEPAGGQAGTLGAVKGAA